jgi:type IV pilus assembly protein PilA
MKKQQGFSLIELLVVLGIIGALTAIAIPQYQKYQDKAKVTAAIATLTNMRSVVEAKIMEDGAFPKNDEENKKNLGIPEEIELTGDGESASGSMKLKIGTLPKSADISSDKLVTLQRKESGGWICTQPLKEDVNNCKSSVTGNDNDNG